MTTPLHEREADVLVAMREHKKLGDAVKELTKQRDLVSAPIREWLDANGPLRDGETGLEARYQERTGPPALDLSSMSDADVLAVARGGLLRAVDGGAAKAIGKNSPRLENLWDRYSMPGKPSTALLVDKP